MSFSFEVVLNWLVKQNPVSANENSPVPVDQSEPFDQSK